MKIQKQKLKKIFEKTTKNNLIHESVLLIENSNGDFSYHNGYGGKKTDTPFLLASITKLFTSTCILILREQGKLSLDDKIAKYFQEDTLRDLHVYKGQEYSMDLTLSNLLFHTSGLPDVIEEGSSKAKKRVIDKDRKIGIDEIIIKTKQLKPHFAPDNGKKAHYANINFDILGKVIEIVTDSTLEDVYKQYIYDPLGLKNTYLPIDENDFVPFVYYKDTSLYRPKMVRSIRASGGCISTARDLMIFIKAFFGGRLFNKAVFRGLDINNKLQATMSPIHYGAGYMRIPLGGLATLFMGKGELLGHSGSTGSFAFYHPVSDLFFVGDVNQIANPALPVRLAMRLAMSTGS
ncbi:serine hydrolase domain-containing protein [Filibacter tadaridae]|uniref:Penicillin-binding protein 4 n=1 Tax=Filibacter tadaridae TaxID=2483811 RepID=A0A3P5WX42_9BACL|nr:serine hydrolase domain-containing protein [Filibacter tadaridae]VDC26012.1 Penicillin-binding protein 4* [Filibacter tadaridae]